MLSLQWKDLCTTEVTRARVDEKSQNEKGFRLFMCVHHFLFCYPKNGVVLGSLFGYDESIVQSKRFWNMLEKICNLKKEKIVWPAARFKAEGSPKIPFSLDCVDCRIREPKHPRYNIDKGYSSHKFKKSGLRYELAIELHQSNLVWINGPFKAGSDNDLTIFRKALKKKVKKLHGKKGMADGGYEGEEDLLCLPSSLDKELEHEYKSRARCRHESFNCKIKKYQSMDGVWRHGEDKHRMAFYAICVTLQYEMENGSPLFDV